MIARANQDLAHDVGNLVNRTVGMVHHYRGGLVSCGRPGALSEYVQSLPGRIDAGLASFDFRSALAALVDVVNEANRLINVMRPLELDRAGRVDELDALLPALARCCRVVAVELGPFVPGPAARIERQLAIHGALPPKVPVFPRLGPAHGGELPQQARGATAMPKRPVQQRLPLEYRSGWVHFEAPFSMARVVLFDDELAPPLGGSMVEVCAVAKRDLRAGEVLDDYGMYMTCGEAVNTDEMSAKRYHPRGPVEGCKSKRDIPKDQVPTYADVVLPEGRVADRLRAEQYRFYGETWLEEHVKHVRSPGN